MISILLGFACGVFGAWLVYRWLLRVARWVFCLDLLEAWAEREDYV